jgi:hypothetical protein
MASLTEDYLFVAAIDFGTTYSGYALSSIDDFKKDPLKIVANQAWNAGTQRHFSLKTPTCLLLNDKEETKSKRWIIRCIKMNLRNILLSWFIFLYILGP